jgi:hypothetical protein
LLLSQLLPDVETERHHAFRLGTVFGMVATQGDQLFANWAAAIGFAFARTRVRDNALHLLTRRQATVGVATLAGVNKRLDTTLDG